MSFTAIDPFSTCFIFLFVSSRNLLEAEKITDGDTQI